METKIECPNCGRAYLIKKKLHLGKREEDHGIENVCECPKCRIIFHEEELGSRLN